MQEPHPRPRHARAHELACVLANPHGAHLTSHPSPNPPHTHPRGPSRAPHGLLVPGASCIRWWGWRIGRVPDADCPVL